MSERFISIKTSSRLSFVTQYQYYIHLKINISIRKLYIMRSIYIYIEKKVNWWIVNDGRQNEHTNALMSDIPTAIWAYAPAPFIYMYLYVHIYIYIQHLFIIIIIIFFFSTNPTTRYTGKAFHRGVRKIHHSAISFAFAIMRALPF